MAKQILIEVSEDKVNFILELLSNFKFVKTKELSPGKMEKLQGLADALVQVENFKKGKGKLKTAKDLLNEL
jgi:hypothetical protein